MARDCRLDLGAGESVDGPACGEGTAGGALLRPFALDFPLPFPPRCITTTSAPESSVGGWGTSTARMAFPLPLWSTLPCGWPIPTLEPAVLVDATGAGGCSGCGRTPTLRSVAARRVARRPPPAPVASGVALVQRSKLCWKVRKTSDLSAAGGGRGRCQHDARGSGC